MARKARARASYVLDWVVILCFAGAGGGLTYTNGFHRPFSLTDDAIAYPMKDNIVSLPLVAIISLVVPAVIIGLVNFGSALLLKPAKSQHGELVGRRERLRAKVWETHAGWLGLCTGLAVTLFITAGLKDMVGKPRPDLLARCNPDLSNIQQYVVGGYGINLDSEAGPLVSSAICRQNDKRLLDDGFASFPSGHSSFSSAGMVYLTLWLCARWSIGIPFLSYSQRRKSVVREQAYTPAPPLWQLALAFAPIFVALFICSSRYADFHHAGFDIIAGAVLGTVCGWASFRLYHLPLRRSQGLLAWGPRSEHNAFVARAYQDDGFQDEEGGRRSIGTELDYLENPSHPPARVDTSGSNRPILEGSGETARGK